MTDLILGLVKLAGGMAGVVAGVVAILLVLPRVMQSIKGQWNGNNKNSSGSKSPEFWTLEISRIIEKKLVPLVDAQKDMGETLRRIEKALLSGRRRGTSEDS